MIRTIIESPYAGEVQANLAYLKECILHSLSLGEAPFASHMFYTQVLDDMQPEQRKLGIEAGFAWGRSADLVAFYVDRGVSKGMKIGYKQAFVLNKPIVIRALIVNDLQRHVHIKELVSP